MDLQFPLFAHLEVDMTKENKYNQHYSLSWGNLAAYINGFQLAGFPTPHPRWHKTPEDRLPSSKEGYIPEDSGGFPSFPPTHPFQSGWIELFLSGNTQRSIADLCGRWHPVPYHPNMNREKGFFSQTFLVLFIY